MIELTLLDRTVHHHSVDYIFWSFGIIVFIRNHFENRVLLKPVSGAWSVLHISVLVINRLSTTEYTIFIYLVHSLLSKNLTI